jgi:hypothetical protein
MTHISLPIFFTFGQMSQQQNDAAAGALALFKSRRYSEALELYLSLPPPWTPEILLKIW